MIKRINLVPSKPLAQKIKQVTLPVTFIASIAALIPLALSYLSLEKEQAVLLAKKETFQKKIEIIEAEQRRYITLKKEVESLQNKKKNLYQELQKLSKTKRQVPPYTELLKALSSTLPDSARITLITVSDGSGTIEGETMKVEDVPSLIERLKKSSYISGMELNELITFSEKNKKIYRFKIQFTLTNV